MLSDEFTKMEERLEKYKKQVRQYKNKVQELSEEVDKKQSSLLTVLQVERNKHDLQQAKERETELKRKNHKLQEMRREEGKQSPLGLIITTVRSKEKYECSCNG